MEILIFIVLLIQALIFGFFCSYIAGEKNRSKGNWFALGFLFSILAVLALMAIPKIENDKSASDSSHSAKAIAKQKAQESLFEGERNLSSSSYQLFLTNRFDIEKNSTLEKFVIDNTVFDTLADALGEADSRYTKHLSMLKAEEERLLREATEQEQNLAKEEAEREKLRRASEALAKEREEHRKKVLRKAMPWAVAAVLLIVVIIFFVSRSLSIREESARLASQATWQAARLASQATWQATGKVVKDCPDCPEMVAIPADSFKMGSATSKVEQPIHQVTIGGFLLARTEITQGQWRAVMGSNPSHFDQCGDDCPVESVSWDDVQEYAKRLSQKTGKTYRLPSEAEWEYAAWADGNKRPQLGQDPWLGDRAGKTHPVAQTKPNFVGLYDMYGNVEEWVQDVSGGEQERGVHCGGSWYTDSTICKSVVPGVRFNSLGFRIARNP